MSKATANSMTFKKLPGVLSFQRCLIMTDGLMYNLHENGSESRLDVVRHGIRGTQNVNEKTPSKEVSNIQTTDSAKTAADAIGVVVRFSVRFMDLDYALFACASSGTDTDAPTTRQMRDAIDDFVARAKASAGLDELAKRYARRLLNAGWLWRNRLLGQKVVVRVLQGQTKIAEADAFAINMKGFDNYTADEIRVAEVVARGLRGESTDTLVVEGVIEFGFKGVVEVFPSQNYITGKPRGFARPLYCVGHPDVGVRKSDDERAVEIRIMGQAALRDQKIGNAVRTIDTWFPRFEEVGYPIPVEPLGANLDAQEFFRTAKGASAFDLMKSIRVIDPASDEGMYLLANLIRGGVFSEGEDKDEKAKKKAKKKAEDASEGEEQNDAA